MSLWHNWNFPRRSRVLGARENPHPVVAAGCCRPSQERKSEVASLLAELQAQVSASHEGKIDTGTNIPEPFHGVLTHWIYWCPATGGWDWLDIPSSPREGLQVSHRMSQGRALPEPSPPSSRGEFEEPALKPWLAWNHPAGSSHTLDLSKCY